MKAKQLVKINGFVYKTNREKGYIIIRVSDEVRKKIVKLITKNEEDDKKLFFYKINIKQSKIGEDIIHMFKAERENHDIYSIEGIKVECLVYPRQYSFFTKEGLVSGVSINSAFIKLYSS